MFCDALSTERRRPMPTTMQHYIQFDVEYQGFASQALLLLLLPPPSLLLLGSKAPAITLV